MLLLLPKRFCSQGKYSTHGSVPENTMSILENLLMLEEDYEDHFHQGNREDPLNTTETPRMNSKCNAYIV